MNFEELKTWIESGINLKQKKNYQIIMLRALLRNDENKLSKKEIQEELHVCNPKQSVEYFNNSPVFDALVNNKIVKFNESENTYQLILDELLSKDEKLKLIDECQRILEDGIANTLEERNRKRYIIKELEEFYGKVDTVQLQTLRKFQKKAGKTLTSKGIRGSGKGGERLRSSSVNAPYLLHSLNRDTYYPEGTGYAQAIYLNPKSRWELEIDREHPTLKINWNYSDSTQHETDKKFMRASYEIGLPIGILFRLTDNRFKCLGLGKITSINENNFVIESFGMSSDESTKIKDDILEAYDEISKDKDVARIPNVNYVELARDDLENRFKDKKLREQVIADRAAYRINELVTRCERNELVIPNFQRFFVWKKELIRNFFDSIFHGYYIGSLLFWEATNQEEIGVTPIKGVDKKNVVGREIILDGQQRVSSVYYALRSPNFNLPGETERSFFYINFGAFLKSEGAEIILIFTKELDPEDQFEKLLFPLNMLEKYDDWVETWTKFMQKFTELDFYKDVNPIGKIMSKKLRFMLEEFGFPHITLKHVELNDVIEIFERINTTGVTLTAFDLLIAKLSIYKINLKDLWDAVGKDHPKVKYYLDQSKNSSQGLLILHAMSLAFTKTGSCKRSDILKIFDNMNSNKEDFENKWREMAEWTDNAIQLLENQTDDGFGVINEKFLPSESMIPVLAALLRKSSLEFSPVEQKMCNIKIRYWYWISALTNVYSGSSDSVKTSDYKTITKWFSEDNIPENISNVRDVFPRNMRLTNVDRQNSSNFKAIISLFVLRGSKDWTQGLGVKTQIDLKNKKLKIDIDHVFPKSLYSTEEHNESILNKILLRTNTNIIKSNKKPSVVLKETLEKSFGNDEKELLSTLETHFINNDAYDALKSNDHQGFQNERQGDILKEIAKRIGANYEEKNQRLTQTTKDSPFGNKVVLMEAYQQCREEMLLVSLYLSAGDINLIYSVRDNLKVKKIRLLTSKEKADKALKSLFKDFRGEMKQKCNIECEMRVMSDDVKEEQHARYLADSKNCWKSFDYTTAARGKSDSIELCLKPVDDLEVWWNDSYDIIEDWNTFSPDK